MNITIIGTGNMGRAIGIRAASAGHSVTFIGRTPEHTQEAVNDVKSSAQTRAQVSSANLENVNLGDIVVLALPYNTSKEVTKQLGTKLAGKIVVDIANPLNASYSDLATAPGSSSAEEVAQISPEAKVVKAFNTVFAGALRSGQVDGRPLDIWIAGDDADAKAKVAQLVKDAGMRPIEAGPLSRARQIEAMQFLHIVTQGTLGTNWGSAIKILG
jgi:NADPH-dependent F420 reductase